MSLLGKQLQVLIDINDPVMGWEDDRYLLFCQYLNYKGTQDEISGMPYIWINPQLKQNAPRDDLESIWKDKIGTIRKLSGASNAMKGCYSLYYFQLQFVQGHLDGTKKKDRALIYIAGAPF